MASEHVGLWAGIGTWLWSWSGSLASVQDAPDFLTTGGFWVGLGGLITAIGATLYPFYKTHAENSTALIKARDTIRELQTTVAGLQNQLHILEARLAGILKVFGIYQEVARTNREWIVRMSREHKLDLPEGFERRALDEVPAGEIFPGPVAK